MLGTTLDKEEVEEFMREADVVIKGIEKKGNISYFLSQDGNGKLDYDEFVKMMLMY